MSYNNGWLHRELLRLEGVEVDPEFQPLIQVTKGNRSFRIYTPEPGEYIISIDIVQKVIGLGGNIISFPTSWSRAAREAVAYGRDHGVDVIPHGRLLNMLSE